MKGDEDVLSKEPLEISFWFYCDEEGDAYALASELQKMGHKIQKCEQVRPVDWLLISETHMPVRKERLLHLVDRFEEMAETHQARFDGWEAVMDYES